MEEEIDLRPYLTAIIKNWYWVLGVAILVGIITFVISSIQPPSYEASALLTVNIPEEFILTSLGGAEGIEPNFVIQNQQIPYLSSFPELATSDQILQELLQSLDPPLDDISNVDELRERLRATSGSDPKLIRLTVTYHDPQTVVTIANKWADLYVSWANEIFGSTSSTKIDLLEDQLQESQVELENAENALIEYQTSNYAQILDSRLNFSLETQAILLSDEFELASLARNVEDLMAQLESTSDQGDATIAHQLTALNLQLKAFDTATSESSLQFLIDDTADLIGSGNTTQIVFLTSLLSIIESRRIQTATDLADLETAILDLQTEKLQAETNHNRFTRLYRQAEETYIALNRMVESERLTAEGAATDIRLAGSAVIPSEPLSRGRLVVTTVGLLTGGLIAVFFIVIREWMIQSAD